MRGSVARELRKIAKFKPSDEREYETWKLPRRRYILSFDEEGKVKPVERIVNCEVVECVSGARKVYKHLKQFYKGKAQEEQLNVLPEEQVLEGIREQMKAEEASTQKEVTNESTKETFRSNSCGQLSSEDESN